MHPALNDIQITTTLPTELYIQLSNKAQFSAKALFVAEKIISNPTFHKHSSRNEPLLLVLSQGLAVIFPFGVIVLINLSLKEEARVKSYIEPYLKQAFNNEKQIGETLEVRVEPTVLEGVYNNVVHIKALTKEHIELIAHVLAKSIMLELYENTIASNFEYVEPIAKDLLRNGRLTHHPDELLKHIGASLLAEHTMVGKIEITEKPNLLWEFTELDLLYEKLMEELEIVERHTILDRKIELLSRTAQTSLDVLQYKHANRLEWYIILLIIASILLEGYGIFFHGLYG